MEWGGVFNVARYLTDSLRGPVLQTLRRAHEVREFDGIMRNVMRNVMRNIMSNIMRNIMRNKHGNFHVPDFVLTLSK